MQRPGTVSAAPGLFREYKSTFSQNQEMVEIDKKRTKNNL